MSGNSVDMLYGDTGSTKTSRLGDAAEYYYETTGKPSRLVSTDTGGWQAIKALEVAGIIIPFRITPDRINMIETLDKLSKGWWVKDTSDPQSPLAPPDNGAACVMFDGATSVCRMLMTLHESSVTYDDRTKTLSPQNIKVPEMPKDSFIKSGDYVRRFVGRSDYGGVQGRISEFIRNSGNLSIPAIWSALEDKGEDESKKPTYGPSFIGQALTGICGNWFGNFIHMDMVNVAVEIENPAGKQFPKVPVTEQRPYMFLRKHLDPNGADPYKLPYPAKTRASKEMWSRVPVVMEPRLDKLYKLLDELTAEEAKQRVTVVASAK